MNPALIQAGISFASGFLSGTQEQQAYRQKAQQAYREAAIYRKNAATVRLNGALNEDSMRAKNRATMAVSSAAMGEAGMGESPTTTTALATSASAMEQNVLNTRYQTESEAENYLYQARTAEENARRYKKKGRNSFMNSMLSGASSALTSYMAPGVR